MIDIDYGPLDKLIGSWEGVRGLDVAPEPDGAEENAYRETIHFSPIGEVVNAEEERYAALQYRQQVFRIPDGKRIHDQSGYWMWNPQTRVIWHCFVIPRGVTVNAVGHSDSRPDGIQVLSVQAAEHGEPGQITQTPFLSEKARTSAFKMSLQVSANQLRYEQTSSLFIYGKSFSHVDNSLLTRVVESSDR